MHRAGFLEHKFRELGFHFPERLRYLPNPLLSIPQPALEQGLRSGFLFFGRLSPEKGAQLLIEAFRDLPGTESLFIAGTGPQEAELKQW
ncbi:MAG: glycosyltransferase [Candidatus Moraniibacteriota bacterium]